MAARLTKCIYNYKQNLKKKTKVYFITEIKNLENTFKEWLFIHLEVKLLIVLLSLPFAI
jgi:replication-associated recombination protein RarA